MEFKGSKTEQNLLKAFIAESQARNKYEWFAKVAEKEGYQQIAELFAETANHELSHAKQFLKYFDGNNIEVSTIISTEQIGTTIENLRNAAFSENQEWTIVYPLFEQIAKEEGFKKIASLFRIIAKVEEKHEHKFRKLIQNIESNRVFESDEEIEWECRKCGYVHKGKKALMNCPACNHPQGYFERKKTNY